MTKWKIIFDEKTNVAIDFHGRTLVDLVKSVHEVNGLGSNKNGIGEVISAQFNYTFVCKGGLRDQLSYPAHLRFIVFRVADEGRIELHCPYVELRSRDTPLCCGMYSKMFRKSKVACPYFQIVDGGEK